MTTWRYQHDSGSVTQAYPTDARGLRFRQQCGYVRVCMDSRSGWVTLAEAIDIAETGRMEMVHADVLRTTVESMTGLTLTLGTMRAA